MSRISLAKLLNITEKSVGCGYVEVARIKERESCPRDEYLSDPVAFHNRRFDFKCGGSRPDGLYMCFLELSKNLWLLTDCKSVENKRVFGRFDEYFGRIIVSFEKKNHSGKVCLQRQLPRMFVHSILDRPFSHLRFPGYDKVRLTFSELRTIINDRFDDWYEALKAVAAIYLITDIKQGGAYVGSAYGEEGLWGRWSTYAKGRFAGTGNDKGLIKRINGDGGYANNFTFSILEVLRNTLTATDVIERENWWKETLQTRESQRNNGMNEN